MRNTPPRRFRRKGGTVRLPESRPQAPPPTRGAKNRDTPDQRAGVRGCPCAGADAPAGVSEGPSNAALSSTSESAITASVTIKNKNIPTVKNFFMTFQICIAGIASFLSRPERDSFSAVRRRRPAEAAALAKNKFPPTGSAMPMRLRAYAPMRPQRAVQRSRYLPQQTRQRNRLARAAPQCRKRENPRPSMRAQNAQAIGPHSFPYYNLTRARKNCCRRAKIFCAFRTTNAKRSNRLPPLYKAKLPPPFAQTQIFAKNACRKTSGCHYPTNKSIGSILNVNICSFFIA